MITSTSNQRIKELCQIQKKSKVRSREGVFVAEGIRMVRETPCERLVSLYFSESFGKKYREEVFDAISGGNTKIREQIQKKSEILSDAVFSYVSANGASTAQMGGNAAIPNASVNIFNFFSLIRASPFY